MHENKTMVLAIAGVTSLLVVVAAIWPLAEQRNFAIDRTIESDFQQISILVDDYYSDESRLPDELSDLDLTKDQLKRAASHQYELDKKTSNEYELCAEFKTDTSGQVLSDSYDFLSSSSFGLNPAEQHSEGLDCVEYQVYGNFRGGFDGGFDDSIFEGFEGFDNSFEAESQVFEL